jgi:hypothetical protein
MEHVLLQWGPLILIVVVFILQNHIFVTPVEMEKKHREILKDVERKYVTLHSFNSLKDQFDEVRTVMYKIYDLLINKEEE